MINWTLRSKEKKKGGDKRKENDKIAHMCINQCIWLISDGNVVRLGEKETMKNKQTMQRCLVWLVNRVHFNSSNSLQTHN